MSGDRRTRRDERRRRLGQNFLRPDAAERFVAETGIAPDELIVEIGAGSGALTRSLVARGARVISVELDPVWVAGLHRRLRSAVGRRPEVVNADFLSWRLPTRPFRVLGSLPFGSTTAILRKLLDDPRLPLVQADLIVQWEVARKRAAAPPSTLLSAAWAPWWEFRLGRRIPAQDFRPIPRVDAGVLIVTRRHPALLPASMQAAYTDFVRDRWPFR